DVCGRIGMGEHETRDPVSEGRLADAGWSRDQPGMRHTVVAIAREYGLLGLRVAKKLRRFPRVPWLQRLAFSRTRDHGPTSSRALAADAGSSRAVTAAQISSATADSDRWASTRTQRSGSFAAMAR